MHWCPMLPLISVACLSVVACGTTDVADVDADATSLFRDVLESATEAGAAPAQLAVLDDAASTGQLTYSALEPLLQSTFACFEDNGLSYQVLEPDETVSGFPYPRYGVGVDQRTSGLSDEQGELIALDCSTVNLDFALEAYGSQPAAQEALDSQLQRDLPGIEACLEPYGVTVPEDATPDEIRRIVVDLYFERSSETEEGPLCYDKLG